MPRRPPLLDKLSLKGLTAAPSQVSGSIRLVPLLRQTVRDDLRLALKSYAEDYTVVALGGRHCEPGVRYMSYVPHAMIVSWSGDGSPVAAFGGRLSSSEEPRSKDPFGVRLLTRMVRKVEPNRLRFLPLHVAMEGFLNLQFGGPDIAWEEYSRRAVATGLSPRWEQTVAGSEIQGLQEALRLFEIHDNQVGVILFVADALASVFVTPHPDDYRLLHQSLLEDFFGELIYRYALQYDTAAHFDAPFDADRVSNLADLRAELTRVRRDWSEFQLSMSGGLVDCELTSERVYRAGPFQLARFVTGLEPGHENHIGESIVREDGTVEYLKSYRLSESQVRRAYLLKQLGAHHWNLEATAASLRSRTDELILRLDRAAFGYLLHEHVLKTAQKRERLRKSS